MRNRCFTVRSRRVRRQLRSSSSRRDAPTVYPFRYPSLTKLLSMQERVFLYAPEPPPNASSPVSGAGHEQNFVKNPQPSCFIASNITFFIPILSSKHNSDRFFLVLLPLLLPFLCHAFRLKVAITGTRFVENLAPTETAPSSFSPQGDVVYAHGHCMWEPLNLQVRRIHTHPLLRGKDHAKQYPLVARKNFQGYTFVDGLNCLRQNCPISRTDAMQGED